MKGWKESQESVFDRSGRAISTLTRQSHLTYPLLRVDEVLMASFVNQWPLPFAQAVLFLSSSKK